MTERIEGKAEKIDAKLALHFLSPDGAGRSSSAELDRLLEECAVQVLAVQDLKAVYSVYGINACQPLDLGFARVESRDLAKSLDGCKRIILFAATAGIGIDRLILKYGKIAPSRAAVIQALGAALIESWCDEICRGFTRKYGAYRHRFSCGFGDLPLTFQREIFSALSLDRTLGVSLSDKCIMTPSKTVTAIVGIRDDD